MRIVRNKHFTAEEIMVLSEICRVASEKFVERANDFRKLEAIKGPIENSLVPTGIAAARMRERFEVRATVAINYSAMFADALNLNIDYEDFE